MKNVNWNTLLISAGFSVLSFISKESFNELKMLHDSVLIIKNEMVPKSEYEVEMLQVKARLSQVEFDIQKMKDHKQ